jgi:hypothetical protein
MKCVSALGVSLIFVALLFLVYYVHAQFARVDVVFYSALFDGIVATCIAAILLQVVPAFRRLSSFERLQLTVIWLLMGYAFAISIPTVIDRSLSFYILEKIEQRGGGIQQSKFEKVFTEEYVREHRLVDVRLTEQLQSGTIRIENGCVKLTERGRRLVSFSRFFRQNLLPKERLLMGGYSDELTDPFRHSADVRDYQCQ